MRDYKTTVVIPAYKNWKLIDNLLIRLYGHERENIDDVIVVDDFSQDQELEDCLFGWIAGKQLPLTVIPNNKNVGFTVSSNIGLKSACKELADKRAVFLISSDVDIRGKFIQQAADILFSPKRSLVGQRWIGWDSGWNCFDGRVFGYLEGFFLAATVDGWRDLGYFDKNYAPFDYEDIDLSTTAKDKGYKLEALNNPFIHHIGGATIGWSKEREAVTLRNKEYFRNKWMK